MTAADDTPSPRPGSAGDLSRRMDRMEEKHDDLAREVAGLTTTVARVETNQNHAEELNKLRFGALDTAVAGLTSQIGAFITRVEGIITGEIQTSQGRQGAELVADYQKWRGTVEERFDAFEEFRTQGRLLAKIAVILVSTNILGVVVAVAAAIAAFQKQT